MGTPTPDTVPPKPDAPTRRRPIWVRVLKWTLVSLAFIVGTPIGLLLALWVVITISPPSYGPSDSTRPVRFTFLDRGFAIPDNYQPSLDSYSGGQPSGFWITVLLPDFAPYSKARRDEWFAVGSGSPSVTMSISSSRRAKRPDELVRRQLDHAIDKNGQPAPAGLRRYDMRDHSTFYDIVYVPEQHGHVTMIGCTVIEGTMTGCRMEATYDHAANLEIAFNSHFLADWRRIADGTRRLLRSFEVKPQ